MHVLKNPYITARKRHTGEITERFGFEATSQAAVKYTEQSPSC